MPIVTLKGDLQTCSHHDDRLFDRAMTMSLKRSLLVFTALSAVLPLVMACVLVPPIPDAEPGTDIVINRELPESVEQAVLGAMAQTLGVTTDTVEIVGSSPQTWSDSCFGLGGPAESCLFVLTDGWQVQAIHRPSGTQYTYRTDARGSRARRQP